MSRKPIAKILVLDGPTHYGLPLPVAGRTDFAPRTRVNIFSPEDLATATRMLPAGQIKVRIFPRVEDVPLPPPPGTVLKAAQPERKGVRRR